MKDIERQLEEVEKAMAAEDGEPQGAYRMSPFVSSVVFWITTVLVASLVVYSVLG